MHRRHLRRCHARRLPPPAGRLLPWILSAPLAGPRPSKDRGPWRLPATWSAPCSCSHARPAAQDAAAFPACLVQCRASIPAPSARLGWSGCSGLPDASCVCWRLMPMAPLHSPANPLPVRKSVADSEIGSRLPTLQRFVFVFGMQLPHSDTQRQHRLRNLMPSSFLIYHCAY